MSKTGRKTKGGITRRGALGAGLAASVAACAKGGEKTGLQVSDDMFPLGIASGDPLSDRVLFWTAIPNEAQGDLICEVAKMPDFKTIAAIGAAKIGATAPGLPVRACKADVDGLQPGTEYLYRFRMGNTVSPTGRTKTLPTGKVDEIKLALISCTNYPQGYFHTYNHIANSEPLDLVLHVGDYIYEYGAGVYAAKSAPEMGRVVDPPHECVSYEDYSRRYIQYHRDANTKAAHAAAPWMIIWDDHESANNPWMHGAQNHQPDKEGSWADREAASLRAFYDWTPSREPAPGLPRASYWRAADFGDLARLMVIETRFSGRSKQITDWPVPLDADPDSPETQAKIKAFEAEAAAPNRHMLGAPQAKWLAKNLKDSTKMGQPWQLLGNQVLLAKVRGPDYMGRIPTTLRDQIKKQSPYLFKYLYRTRFHTWLNLDAWDGYGAARERLYDKVKAAGANLVVLTGDTHEFNASILNDNAGTRVGVELGTSSVSSPGTFTSLWDTGVDWGKMTEDANPDVVLHDASSRGYIRLTVRPDEAVAQYIGTSSVLQKEYTTKVLHTFHITKDEMQRSDA